MTEHDSLSIDEQFKEELGEYIVKQLQGMLTERDAIAYQEMIARRSRTARIKAARKPLGRVADRLVLTGL